MFNEINKRTAEETARVSKMTKKAIVAEMVERDFLDPRSADYKCRTWKKTLLVNDLVGRIIRKEWRGY